MADFVNHLPFVRNVRIRGGNKPMGLPEGVSMIFEKLGGTNLEYKVEADLDVAALYAFMNEEKVEDEKEKPGVKEHITTIRDLEVSHGREDSKGKGAGQRKEEGKAGASH